MTEQELQQHEKDIEIILELMNKNGLKQVYKTNKDSVEFLYFDDVNDDK